MARRPSCPFDRFDQLGLLNGLQASDAFFDKLGASVSDKTFCTSGSCMACLMAVGRRGDVDSESFVLGGLNALAISAETASVPTVIDQRQIPFDGAEARRAARGFDP